VSARAVGVLLLVAGCTTSLPAMPGQYFGSYVFKGQLVVDPRAPQTTTCLLDGGVIFWPSVVQFSAQVSWLPDAGVVYWQIQNGPLRPGTFSGAAITVSTDSAAQVSGCGCAGTVTETVTLSQVDRDSGSAPPELTYPVAGWAGGVVDQLAPMPSIPGFNVCEPDAGPGCGLNCQLVYAVLGTPGLP
jgi:hypothetical protein